ncbi:MAG: hypothetical protein EI684_08605 [Candidatus Viridilinea halotolerans]|uniref:Uncharacterized protein n=1 Tax=Candidatus Viridilinea halotolerans TaxID=2491704 RepID=A0A426U223_9CHLR|nr:MAG: hypothetical protein EI684_08605 [Candidatus Viridilinea halotolerans]
MSDTYTFTVEIYTSALVFSGSYDLPLYRRVSDALNSRMHRFIALREATIAPLARPQHMQRVPQILVDWSNALLVATVSEPEPPPGFQMPSPPRDTQPMMFFTAAFALRADFFKRTDRQLVEMFDEMNDDFIPLTNVQIFPHSGGAPLNRKFVCLHRQHIQALYVLGAQIANAPVPSSMAPAITPPPAPPPEPEPEPVPEAEADDTADAERSAS